MRDIANRYSRIHSCKRHCKHNSTIRFLTLTWLSPTYLATDIRTHKVLQITRRSNETRNLKAQSSDILFNTMLAVKVVDVLPFSSRAFVDFVQGTEDDMFDANCFRDISHKFSFLFLFDILRAGHLVGKVVSDDVESVGSFQRCFKGGLGCDVTLLEDNVVAMFEKSFGSRFLDVTSQCANLAVNKLSGRIYLIVRIIGERPQDRTTLIPCN